MHAGTRLRRVGEAFGVVERRRRRPRLIGRGDDMNAESRSPGRVEDGVLDALGGPVARGPRLCRHGQGARDRVLHLRGAWHSIVTCSGGGGLAVVAPVQIWTVPPRAHMYWLGVSEGGQDE